MSSDATSQVRTDSDEVAALRREVRELKDLVARLSGEVVATSPPPPPVVSRRSLLRSLPAAAAVGIGAGALSARPAAAAESSPLLLGQANDAGGTVTSLTSDASPAFVVGGEPGGVNDNYQYSAIAANGIEIRDLVTQTAYLSLSSTSYPYGSDARFSVGSSTGDVNPLVTVAGAVGNGRTDFGLDAMHVSSHASTAVTASTSTAVNGPPNGGPPYTRTPGLALLAAATTDSTGVRIAVESGRALESATTDAAATLDAFVIANAGLGRTVYATSGNSRNNVGTVTGVNSGTGAGIWGATNETSTGPAVVGWAGAKGRGGRFRGGAAAITLSPVGSTHPATGSMGDLTTDTTGRLWFCKGGAVWTQLA